MEIFFFIELTSVSLFNKLLRRPSRGNVKCLYESINLKVIEILLKSLIEKVKNVSKLLEIQLLLELGHFSAKYVIINLKSNFAPL